MSNRIVLLALLSALATGCKNIDCGDGTTERDGVCVPANETIGTATCGATTELRGTVCEAKVQRMCDPDTTDEVIDITGVHICVGTGGTGCAAKLPCPQPGANKQTICGQLYDFENNQPFAAAGATGAQCTPGSATTGPCALGIKTYDAVVFAMTGGGELATGPVYIDDCGRYKIPEVSQPGPPGFIALGIDDATGTPGPSGVTNATGIITPAANNKVTRDLEAFIVKASTYQGWATSGAPSLAAGIYAPVFRGHRTGTDLATGVTVTFAPMSMPTNMTVMMGRDFYFPAAATARTTLDPAANATGMNGTALVAGATLTEVYSGTGGGIPSQCLWEVHAAQAIAGVILVQIFRPTDFPQMTCPL